MQRTGMMRTLVSREFAFLLIYVMVSAGDSGGVCTTKLREGKLVSEGNCGDRRKSSVLAELDGKLKANPEAFCYLGMKSRDIPDSSITASSIYDKKHKAHLGRLDQKQSGSFASGWSTRPNPVDEWIQIDLGYPKLVGGLITQGRKDWASQWVESYKVSCGTAVENLSNIRENGIEKIFDGNTDEDTKVTNMFPEPMMCRHVRIYAQTWHGWISMRIELIRGECFDLF